MCLCLKNDISSIQWLTGLVVSLYPGQNNFMKFQPFTVLTKTRWISFLRVALLSAWWAFSSHFFPHQILPSRALATAWQSPPAWRPLCFSPSPWPPCQQTQSRTGCLEEPVQSCPRPPSMHPQNPLKKPKDRFWELRPRGSRDCDGVVSSRLAVKCFAFPVMCDHEATGERVPCECSAPRMKAADSTRLCSGSTGWNMEGTDHIFICFQIRLV